MRGKPSALSTIINEYRLSHTRRNRLISLILVLSVFVGGGVFWQLRLTGISMSGEAYCGFEEHEHSENCIEKKLICPFDDDRADGEESDVYEPECLLTCSLPEHIHTEACYDTISVLICSDGHTHTESCYEIVSTLICDEDHEHTADCYLNDTVLICTEGHEHTESCYELKQVCICNEQEHQHSDACYQTSDDSIYRQEENQGHVHTEECYEDVYVCGFEPEYSHVHTLQCYSNPEADIEYASTWERTIQNVELTGVWADDLLAIARTQLGYQESTQNYQVQEDGTTMNGITRYGQWYGDAYGDWCAMFVSWCLNYAEISNNYLPYNSGCQRWVEALTGLGFYEPSGNYSPAAGDIIFYDFEEDGVRDGRSDHVGIVSEISIDEGSQKTIVHTIEGNWGNAVCTQRYRLDSDDILGYCNLDAIYQLYGVKPIEEPEIPPIRSMNAAVYTDASYSDLSESAAEIIVVGVIPEGAEIKAYPVEVEIENCQVVCAYDISIFLADGTVYEPEIPLTVQINTNSIVEGDEQTKTVYFVPEEGEVEQLESETTENGVQFSADHFSIYAVTTTDITYSAVYNENSHELTSLTLTLPKNSIDTDLTYYVQYSDDGYTWSDAGVTGVKPKNKNDPLALTVVDGWSTTYLNSSVQGSANRRFQIYGEKKKNNGQIEKTYTSGNIPIGAVFDTLAQNAGKSGFIAWVNGDYPTLYGVNEPITITELITAYEAFLNTPTIAVQRIVDNGNLLGVEAVLGTGYVSDNSDEYHWQYYDSTTEEWVEFNTNDVPYGTEQNPLPSAMSDILLNNGKIRCVLYRQLNPNAETKTPVAISNEVTAAPTELEITAAIAAINSGLNLDDLSIGGNRFTSLFYYGNVARDTRVPFSDAASYSRYLAETYINYGNDLQEVSNIWYQYLYDLYDPADDRGNMSNKNQGYPNNQTYGDEGLGWPKDADSNDSSPFHGNAAPVIKDLDYNYLENGVDYSNFITGLEKTAAGVAPGDGNTERLYNINLHADVQAKVNAPVALILQIQTSWQMFDLAHANANIGQGSTEVGAAAVNSALANLYDIKQALLRLADYMETYYPGNNLVIGITDVEHAGTYSMFNINNLYVTNDFDVLRTGLYGWDTFGNCEHVHYTSTALTNAVANLESNLSGWKDMYGYELDYDDIRKVGVIVGGATEASASKSGWKITLPWNSFSGAGFNSVYGIKTNQGTAYSGQEASWLDYSGNNGTAFKDGTGTGFTKKYTSPSEQAVFEALLDIVNTEMHAQGIDIFNPQASVDNYRLSDTVQNEFKINYAQPFTLTVKNTVLSPDFNSNGGTVTPEREDYVTATTTIPVDMSNAVVTQGDNGDIVRTYSNITYTVPLLQETATVHGELVVTEHTDNTTTVDFTIDRAFNNSDVDLQFQVQARDKYIGSNNVFTNVETPTAQYEHIGTDNTVETYPVLCTDRPKVNVPIRFDVENGESTTIFVGDEVEIAELAEAIVQDAEYRAKLYNQINGTLTYSWTLPGDGTQNSSVTIQNGIITTNDGDFPDYTHLFEGETPGSFPGTLTVKFTPETTDDQSRQGVSELALSGTVNITVVDATSKTDFYVEKQWPSGDGGNDSITFHLLCNGVPILDENTNQPKVYTLNAANDWKMLFENMSSAVKDSDNQNVIAVYSVEETPVPEGFSPSYLQNTESITTYATEITSFTFSVADKDKDKLKKCTVTVHFTSTDGSDSCSYSFAAGDKPSATFTKSISRMRPVGEDGEALEYTITSISAVNDKGHALPSQDIPAISNTSVSTGKVESGIEVLDKLVIRNLPSFVLPETGGSGLLPYTLGALLLAAGALMYRYILKRKPKERRSKM